MNNQTTNSEFQVSITSTSEVDKELSIQIPRSAYSKQFEKEARKVAQVAQVKGFRPGKVPSNVVVKMYGDTIHYQVIEELVSSAVTNAIVSNDLKVVGRPKVDFVKTIERDSTDDIEIKAEVAVYPEPEIKNYEKLEATVKVKKYTEDLLNQRIEKLAESYAKLEKVTDRTEVEATDTIFADVHVSVDGALLERGGHMHHASIDLSGKGGKFPKELCDKIVGMKVGDEKEIEAVLSQYFEKEVQGKTGVYKIKVLELCKKTAPVIDDVFVVAQGLADSMADYRSKVEKQLVEEIEDYNNNSRSDAVLQQIADTNPFLIPQVLVDEEIKGILAEIGVLDPRSERARDLDTTPFRKHFSENAEKRVRKQIVLGQIVKQEQLSPSLEDIEAWIEKEIAKGGGITRDYIKQFLRYPERTDYIKDYVARVTILDKLISGAKLSEVEETLEAKGEEL